MILLLFFLLRLCFSQNNPYTIFPNSFQTQTLTVNSSLAFKISNTEYPSIGLFNITVTPSSNRLSNFIVLTQTQCDEGQRQKASVFERASNHIASAISFIANTSDANCFHIELAQGFPAGTLLTCTLKVEFSPIETILTPDSTVNVELLEKKEIEIAYINKNQTTEVIQIILTNLQGALPDFSKTSVIQLKHQEGPCMKSMFNISWICHIPKSKSFFRFSLYNPDKSALYEMSILEHSSFNANQDTQISLPHSIPGFGTLIKVDLPQIGVLKVRARVSEEIFLPVIAASSLYDLFTMLSNQSANLHFLDNTSIFQKGIGIQNKQCNTSWYYFVQEQGDNTGKHFLLNSYFSPQVILKVGDRTTFHINPEIYEYQHIYLNIGVENTITACKVIVCTNDSNNSMALYFDTSLSQAKNVLFPNEYIYKEKVLSNITEGNKVSLEFIVNEYDTSVYLSIQVLKKGSYVIETLKTDQVSLSTGIFIIGLLVFMIIYIFSCISKIGTMNKSNETDDDDDFIEWPELPREIMSPRVWENSLESDSQEENSSEIEVQVHVLETDDNERQAQENTITSIQKVSQTQLEEETDTNPSKNSVTASLSEEDVCDICYEAKKSVLFNPCGHKCACLVCTSNIIKISPRCPLCRADIEDIKIDRDCREKLMRQE